MAFGVIPMMKTKAVIEWFTKDQGGRVRPPLGIEIPPYSTVVRFTDEPWPPTECAWSLIVVKDGQSSTEFRWLAGIRFLMDDAPHDCLRTDRTFELYEGNKRVARGRIIENGSN